MNKARHTDEDQGTDERGEISLTADLKNGDKEQVLRRLKNEGVKLEQFVAIGKDETLAEHVAAAMHYHTLFSTPEEQIERMLELNKKVWHDPEMEEELARFRRNFPQVPVCPAPICTKEVTRFYCRFLHYEFREQEKYEVSPLNNFWRYWRALEYLYGIGGVSYDGHSREPKRVTAAEKKSLIFSEGAYDSHRHGFYWYVVEFGYRFGETMFEDAEKTFREQKLWALGHEVLAMYLMHPRWVEHFEPTRNLEKMTWSAPTGYGYMAPLDLMILSHGSRTYHSVIHRMDGRIRFTTTAGVRQCPIPYVVNRVPSDGWEFRFPKAI